MKHLADIFTPENGLFKIFAENFATEFTEYFGTNTAANIDLYVNFNFGTKILNNSINADNAENIVKSIITLYIPIWDELNGTLNLEYNPSKSEIETHTKNGTIERVGGNENTTTNAEKAFNDTNFVDSEKTTNAADTENTETYNLTETITRQGANVVNSIKYEYDFRKSHSLQLEIINNLVNAITLLIY